jgi:F420-dependent oxidoreductase-like protein
VELCIFTEPQQGASYEDQLAQASAAERLGFDGWFRSDHFLAMGASEGLPGPTDAWTTLAGLARETRRIRLGTLVSSVTFRHPSLLAIQVAQVDAMSGGRVELGLGTGWFAEEHAAYGIPFPPLRERFERLEDALRIARAMFTQEESSVGGRHHSTQGAINNPQPVRGDIPIMVGGSGERKTLRLVAQYADGCNIFGDVERARHLMGVLDGHCEAVGRDPREITRTRNGVAIVARTHEAAQRKLEAARQAGMPEERIRMAALVGDADGIAEQARAFLDVGIEGLTLSIPDVHDLETVTLVGEALSPLLG